MGADADIELVRIDRGEFLVEPLGIPQFVVREPVAVLYCRFDRVGCEDGTGQAWTNLDITPALRSLVVWGDASLVIVPGCLGLVVVPVSRLLRHTALGSEWAARSDYEQKSRDARTAYELANMTHPGNLSYSRKCEALAADPGRAAEIERLCADYRRGYDEACAAGGPYVETRCLPLGGESLLYLRDAWAGITPGRWIVNRYWTSGCGEDAPYYNSPRLPEGVAEGARVQWEIWT